MADILPFPGNHPVKVRIVVFMENVKDPILIDCGDWCWAHDGDTIQGLCIYDTKEDRTNHKLRGYLPILPIRAIYFGEPLEFRPARHSRRRKK